MQLKGHAILQANPVSSLRLKGREGLFRPCLVGAPVLTAGSGGNCQGKGRDCDSRCAGCVRHQSESKQGSVCVGRDLGKHK